MIGCAEEFARLRLSESLAEQVRATHEEASLEVWLDVVARFPELREWVVHNKTVPLQVLERLCTDPSANVRRAVAAKRKLTSELRSILATDADATVRASVARNAKCQPELLRLLAADPVALVSEAALKSLSMRQNAA
jgi:hypothetical protein